ncbi:protein of unknown function [Mycolicibacterium rutilum]|uniref:Protein-glutamine gamma-glutamyltransferase-like C-terminal domain-containing protein n=1 Tax=Mycolicibacterium rutilum TaxID=370526 RepID=A0A1H6IUS5_MYCRU|nr:DUF4129 domain-containing protein [Mycolicibacterium rutilum]SEH52759.1 protein of unknown function [Mycolicibacterium rutilum]
MGASETSTRRVIAVITLMALAAVSLRGYLPDVEPPGPREPHRSNPLALAAVLALLCAAVAIIGLAVIARLRSPRPVRAPAGSVARESAPGRRPSWRLVVVALLTVIGWLLAVSLLSRLIDPAEPPAPPEATTVDEPAAEDPAEERRADPAADDEPPGNVVNYLIPPMLVLMALIVVGSAVASRRRPPSPTPDVAVDRTGAPPTPRAPSLARAAEIGLAEIGDVTREPREAIIACYAAMERELTRVPGAAPQACDTPTEVLARAVDSGALRADSATELVHLFEEARFSPHVMTESHRDAAVQVLNRVLAELPQREAGAVT